MNRRFCGDEEVLYINSLPLTAYLAFRKDTPSTNFYGSNLPACTSFSTSFVRIAAKYEYEK